MSKALPKTGTMVPQCRPSALQYAVALRCPTKRPTERNTETLIGGGANVNEDTSR